MNSTQNDLAKRLSDRQRENAYQRLRQTRRFSHRMRAVGIVGAFFFVLLVFVLKLLALHLPAPFLDSLTRILYPAAWLYLATLPLLLGWRTRLWAYVLQEHWIWLAAWFGLTLDFYVIRFSIVGWRWIPVVFFGLLVLGWVLRTWRKSRFLRELKNNERLWDRLQESGILDLLLVGYWNIRREA